MNEQLVEQASKTKPGLRPITADTKFACTMCGKCCFFTKETLEKFSVEKFGWKLKEDGSCQHLTADKKCGIYEKRPLICRLYPFFINEEELAKGKVSLLLPKLLIDPNATGFGTGPKVAENPAIKEALADVGRRMEKMAKAGKKSIGEILYSFPED
ncbi:MAG: YkgJ family cysteine cluster protein [DPANN group archaeon]|nr:YkgJ family cysteine cluster protein [DPANN group archaeon]